MVVIRLLSYFSKVLEAAYKVWVAEMALGASFCPVSSGGSIAGSSARGAGERTDHFYMLCLNLQLFRIIFSESAFVAEDVVRSGQLRMRGPFSLMTVTCLP